MRRLANVFTLVGCEKSAVGLPVTTTSDYCGSPLHRQLLCPNKVAFTHKPPKHDPKTV